MKRGAAVAGLLLALAGGGAAAVADRATDDEVSRLAGHTLARASGGGVRVLDVAGEGTPEVGVVERRGRALWLVTGGGGGERALRLAGPLAVPRIAGPGYKVWALGRVGADGALWVRRLGVLRRPAID
jgi:hypothetical protein